MQNLINEERIHLLQRIYRTDFRNHGSLGKGKLIYRLSDELKEFYEDQWRFCELLTEIIAVVTSVTWNLLRMDWRFLLLFYGLIPMCVFITLKKAGICVETHEARHAAGAEYHQILKEDVEGMYEISCMNQIPYFLTRFGQAVEISQTAEKRHAESVRTYQIYDKSFEFICYGGVFLFALWLIRGHFLGAGYLITVMGYAASFYLELAQINYAKDLWLDIRAIRKDLDEIEALKPIEGGDIAKADLEEEIAVKLENVAFAYGDSGMAEAWNFNLEVKRGEKVAIMGTSGKGKSTLLRLLCRLVEPDNGRIYLFGHCIKAYSLDALRKVVTYMPQSAELWEGSIEENIFWGKAEGTVPAELTRKMEQLNISYDSQRILKSGGTDLSGGEVQRIALLRALYSGGSLLLLDEPTSNMDTENTAIIYDLIRRLPGSCTVIIVTHDKQISEYVDRVVEIDEFWKDPNVLSEAQQI